LPVPCLRCLKSPLLKSHRDVNRVVLKRLPNTEHVLC
jgi:hypothetical protein